MDVEKFSNGGGVRSNWQWCGMGKRRRLKSSKFRVEEKEKPKTHPSKPRVDCIRAKAPFGTE
jgi:hypothetical protein